MIKFCDDDKRQLIATGDNRNVFLEGNIIKLIDAQDDEAFKKYLFDAKAQDIENRKKRLEVTKQVQIQNRELITSQEENEKLMIDLKEAVKKADEAKDAALTDLDLIQKKTQFELIGKIVQVALWIIVGVGVFTTLLFMFAMFTNRDLTIIGNTWSNLFGILLTNSFSIIGTIMGVKYASEGNRGKI
tara:strand:- start:444 stop:1004 length:561 start_codon:yes stop_codon:yes gene_type:complete